MANPALVALIIGAGPQVGQSVARAFAAKGYKVAIVSRSLNEADSTPQQLHIPGDVSDPSAVDRVFARVRTALGPPSVVVYNAFGYTHGTNEDPLAISVADFARDLSTNVVSVYAAAQQAVAAFRELPDTASRTFILTGNGLNTKVHPAYLNLGLGKTAAAYAIEAAAIAYADKGFKFYYADQREPGGGLSYHGIDADAHAVHYVELAEGKSQGPWQQTFVKGEGYQDFAKK